MNRKRSAFVFLISALLISSQLLSCAPEAALAPASTVFPSAPGAAPDSPGWEAEWQRLIEGARKEGTVSMVGGSALGPEARNGLIKAFSKEFGVNLEIIVGPSSVTEEKVLRERRAGLFTMDIITGGPTSFMTTYKPQGVVVPLDKVLFRPDVIDEKLWRGYNGVFFDKAHMIAGGEATVNPAVNVNSDLVQTGEVKSFKDLLNPKWKEKILINDPTRPGQGGSAMQEILAFMGEDFVRKLVEQKPVVVRDERQIVEWLARGKYAIAIGASSSVIFEFQKAGVTTIAPLMMAEGSRMTPSIACIGLVDRAPHPNAAKLFINWFLTKDGHTLYNKLTNLASRRTDVESDWLEPYRRPQPGVKYLVSDEEWRLKASEYMNQFKEIFKPVM